MIKEKVEQYFKTWSPNAPVIEGDEESWKCIYDSLDYKDQQAFERAGAEDSMTFFRMLYRFWDAVGKRTWVDDDGELCITPESSLFELPISEETALMAVTLGISTLGDIAERTNDLGDEQAAEILSAFKGLTAKYVV